MITLQDFIDAGVRTLDRPPAGWRRIEGARTAPNGWEWWGHGSRFWRMNGLERYEHALVRAEGR